MKNGGDRARIKLYGKQIFWLNLLIMMLAADLTLARYSLGEVILCAISAAIAAASLGGIWMERKTQAIVRERWAIEDESGER